MSTSYSPDHTGVANPYALAELVAGRRIDWRRVKDRRRLLESIMGWSYDELLDPSTGSPLYAALYAWLGIQVEETDADLGDGLWHANDRGRDVTSVKGRTLGELVARYPGLDLEGLRVEDARLAGTRRLRIELELPMERPSSVDAVARIPRRLRRLVTRVPEDLEGPDDWMPEGCAWVGGGEFFEEAAEFFDPLQGVVANCYLVAALSSVAWAWPYGIAHRTRATGSNQSDYASMVPIYEDDGTVTRVEVGHDIVRSATTGKPVSVRSSEPNEIWPAIYEKAYAKWLTGVDHDHPDVTATAYGSVFAALQRLTGVPQWHVNTRGHGPRELWDMVRENSRGHRTFKPMATGTAVDALLEEGYSYAGTGIVPAHAYSILGWDYRGGVEFLILRNPWGTTEATVGALSGATRFYDMSWWRSVDLAPIDGVFGISADEFRNYFYYIGGCE